MVKMPFRTSLILIGVACITEFDGAIHLGTGNVSIPKTEIPSMCYIGSL